MKKTLLIPSLLGISLSGFSQITIEFSDIWSIGDSYTKIIDTTTAETGGNAGANQTWDFSTTKGYKGVQKVVDATTTPYASKFPNATHAITDDTEYFYFKTENDTSKTHGAALYSKDLNMVVGLPFKNPMITATYPLNYEDSLNQTYDIDEQVTVSGIKGRLLRSGTINSKADAWGSVITPSGTFDCLRYKVVDTYTQESQADFFGNGSWSTLSKFSATEVTYQWYTKNFTLPFVQLHLDTIGLPKSLSYIDTTTAAPITKPVADFVSNATSGFSFDFTDKSSNTPDKWSWDFGDGDTSTVQNPSHTYSASGTYTVCLIAENSAGSDTSCNDVTIISTGLNTKRTLNYLEMYPNPTNGLVTFNIYKELKTVIDVYNIMGELVLSTTSRNSSDKLTIDFSSHPKGIYFVQISNSQSNSSLKLILK